MPRKRLNVLSTIALVISAFFAAVSPVHATVLQNLNGATGSTQTFQNDTNVKLTTNASTNTHALGWQGVLSVLRGGTGSSSFSSGSLLFFDGSSFAQNNSKLFWDNTNHRLGLGNSTPTAALDITGDAKVSGTVSAGAVSTTIGNVISYDGFDTGPAGGLNLQAADGQFSPFYAADFARYNFTGGPNQFSSNSQFFDFTGSLNNNTYKFPDISGTVGLLEGDQTWTGLNKFESNTNSTIYVGSSTKTGCIALGDVSGGITYVTANAGVLTATTIKPSTCQ